MQLVALTILAFLIIGIPATTLAHEKKEDKTKVEVKVKNKPFGFLSNHNKASDEAKIKQREEKLEIDDQEFEISGEITAVVGNNFTVLSQTIFIDPSQVKEFKQKGILEVGKRVKVKGLIKNGVKFAQEINVVGTGQGRLKFEIKDVKRATPSATTSSNLQVKVKAVGPINQVTTFLQQILDFLKNLS